MAAVMTDRGDPPRTRRWRKNLDKLFVIVGLLIADGRPGDCWRCCSSTW